MNDKVLAVLVRRGPSTKYTLSKLLRPRRMAPLTEALEALLEAGAIEAIETPRGGTAYFTTTTPQHLKGPPDDCPR